MRKRTRWVAVALLVLSVLIGWWLWHPAPAGDEAEAGRASSGAAEEGLAHALPAGWAALHDAKLPDSKGTLAIRGQVIGPLGPISGAQVVATEAGGEEILSARECQCDDHCGNKLLECGCAEAARQLHELVAARMGEAQPIARAVSDAEGNFSLEGLAEGSYGLWGSSGERAGVLAAVKAGDENVKLELSPGMRVEGRVVDEDEAPVVGAWVTGIFVSSSRFFDATSGADGGFALVGLPNGSFRFVAAHPGLLPASSSLDPDIRLPLVLKMEFPRGLSGLVTSSEKPAAGAKVELFGEHRRASAVAGPDGRYALSGLRPGEYAVRASGAGGIARASVTLDERETQLNLELGPSARVSGRVTDETGRPVAAEVVATVDRQVVARFTADADGLFQLPELPPGHYDFVAHLDRRWGEETVSRDLAAGADERVELKIFVGVEQPGRVVDPDGRPVSGAKVRLSGAKAGRPATAESDADGGFTVKGVAPGQARWSATHDDWLTASGQLDVPESDFVVHLEAGATLQGEFVDEDNKPLQGEVTARPDRADAGPSLEESLERVGDRAAAQAVMARYEASRASIRHGRSDVQGKFELKGLQPGHYVVSGDAPPDLSVRAEADVPARATVTVKLQLKPGAVISGGVFDATGRAVGGVQLYAYPTDDRRAGPESYESPHRATSQPDGGFVLSHLTKGATYGVMAVDRENFGNRAHTVEAKAPSSGVRVTLLAQTHVRGRAVTPAGQPVLQFTVDGSPKHTPDGRFDVVARPGRWQLELEAKGYAPTSQMLKVPEGGLDVGDVVLDPGRALTVTVVDEAGKPVPKAVVVADASGSSFFGSDDEYDPREKAPPTTDDRGRAQLSTVPSGDTALAVRHPSYVPAQQKVPAGAVEVTVTLAKGGQVSGALRQADGGVAAYVTVEANQEDGPGTSFVASMDGGFVMSNLAPGTWTLVARARRAISPPVRVTVQAGAVTTADLVFTAGVPVSFRVTGTAEAHAYLLLSPVAHFQPTTVSALTHALGSAVTLRPGPDGSWTGENVAPGAYTLLRLTEGEDTFSSVATADVVVPREPGGPIDVTFGPTRKLEESP